MSVVDKLLHRAFGVPTGILGRIGGKIMAGRHQRSISAQVGERLAIRPGDRLLEVGFGPGIAIAHMVGLLGDDGVIVGIDPSDIMVEAASSRNVQAIARGTVNLIKGTVEHIPYPDSSFDKAYAMNSFHLWPDKFVGLREIRRVLKPGGLLLLSFYGPALQDITSPVVQEQLKRAEFKETTISNGTDGVLYVMARSVGG